eukprot:XP_001705578.1 Hypothetical protein GL50803_38229 [Giardia lamblia ATCC 50803]
MAPNKLFEKLSLLPRHTSPASSVMTSTTERSLFMASVVMLSILMLRSNTKMASMTSGARSSIKSFCLYGMN